MNVAYISEIFPTVQGEGPFTGERQIFVRLAGCPLRCDYCDTPGSLTAEGHQRMDVHQVLKKVIELRELEKIQTVSLTGGEPLAHISFLKELVPLLKENNFKIYLETAGVHPEALSQIISHCDIVSMDIKLPSATGKEFWDQHREFLKVGEGKIFAKIVLENHSQDDEIEKAIQILEALQYPPQLVLQLATPIPAVCVPPSEERVENILLRAKKKLKQVSVMKQQHKIWGIR